MLPDSHLAKWEQRHSSAEGTGDPVQVLLSNLHLLPGSGSALDLACGRGRNALFLAEAGLDVTAWDFSTNAINRLKQAARENGLKLTAEVRDVVKMPPQPASFDLVLVSYFLERSILEDIKRAVRPGGLLMYETFTRDALDNTGPTNQAWRLETNELLTWCSEMRIHYYREDARQGDLSKGVRNAAMIVASPLKSEDIK